MGAQTQKTPDVEPVYPTSTDMTLHHALRDLTGWEEIAAQKVFGEDWLNKQGTISGRAVIFAHCRRVGIREDHAKAYALGLKIGAVDDYFPDVESPESGEGGDSGDE